MRCSACGLEMVIYQTVEKREGGRETVYACRNRRCLRFDKRLKRPEELAEDTAGREQ